MKGREKKKNLALTFKNYLNCSLSHQVKQTLVLRGRDEIQGGDTSKLIQSFCHRQEIHHNTFLQSHLFCLTLLAFRMLFPISSQFPCAQSFYLCSLLRQKRACNYLLIYVWAAKTPLQTVHFNSKHHNCLSNLCNPQEACSKRSPVSHLHWTSVSVMLLSSKAEQAYILWWCDDRHGCRSQKPLSHALSRLVQI